MLKSGWLSRVGCWRYLQGHTDPLSGGSDTTCTIIWEMELENLTAFEALPAKMGTDSEMQVLFPKLNAVIDSIVVEF